MATVCPHRPFFPPEDYACISPDLTALLKAMPNPQEGHLSPNQAEFLYCLVRLIRPSFVVETGLNVGHSACVVMLAQRSVGVEPCLMSIDICAHDESRLAAVRIKSRFENFMFVEGDSKEALVPAVDRVLRERRDLRLQLGVIDGGHDVETVQRDLENLTAFLSLGGYLWLDDFEKVVPNYGVNRAGRSFAASWGNCLRFRTEDTRGFMLYQKGF